MEKGKGRKSYTCCFTNAAFRGVKKIMAMCGSNKYPYAATVLGKEREGTERERKGKEGKGKGRKNIPTLPRY